MSVLVIPRRASLIALVAAAACGSDGGGAADGADAGPATAALGTGSEQYEALTDGADVFVVQGPQGGFHLFGSVAVTGIDPGNPNDRSDPSNPTTEFRVFQGSERIDLGAARYTQGLEPVAGQTGVGMVGRLVILDIAADDELDGVQMRFEVQVTDTAGAMASDARSVIGVPHPNNL